MNDPERVAFVHEKFPQLQAAEMEAAAIAQFAYQFGTHRSSLYDPYQILLGKNRIFHLINF